MQTVHGLFLFQPLAHHSYGVYGVLGLHVPKHATTAQVSGLGTAILQHSLGLIQEIAMARNRKPTLAMKLIARAVQV